jgi:hypothetical protein
VLLPQINWRLSDDPVTPNTDPAHTDAAFRAATRTKIYLGYTSNLISAGVREQIRCAQSSVAGPGLVEALVSTALLVMCYVTMSQCTHSQIPPSCSEYLDPPPRRGQAGALGKEGLFLCVWCISLHQPYTLATVVLQTASQPASPHTHTALHLTAW